MLFQLLNLGHVQPMTGILVRYSQLLLECLHCRMAAQQLPLCQWLQEDELLRYK